MVHLYQQPCEHGEVVYCLLCEKRAEVGWQARRKRVKWIGETALPPNIFYGTVGSGILQQPDRRVWNELSNDTNVLCFEVGPFVLSNVFDTVMIRGISGYCGVLSRENQVNHAAMAAAAYAKTLLQEMQPVQKPCDKANAAAAVAMNNQPGNTLNAGSTSYGDSTLLGSNSK